MSNVFLGILFGYILFHSGLVNCDSKKQQKKPVRPLEQLANVVRFFPTTELCNHICNTTIHHDGSGCLHISFKTDLKRDEKPGQLCDCMYNYINQNNWLKDIDHKCSVKDGAILMVLSGHPRRDYDPNAEVMTNPVATLAAVLKHYPTASLDGHSCKSYDFQQDQITHLRLECQLTKKSPRPQKVCQNIMAYLNQGRWLDKAKNNCSSKGDCLYLKIVGK